MSERWKKSRLAADYGDAQLEYERSEAAIAAADTETLTVAGVAIGATYGASDDDEFALQLLGDGYLKPFASATPAGRAGAYSSGDAILGIDDREEQRRLERERLGGTSIQSLMTHYVAKDARGRSGSGRKVPKKPAKIESAVLATIDDEKPAVGSRAPGTICIDGLTRGERAIFVSFQQFNLPEAVVVRLAAGVRAGYFVPETESRFKQLGSKTRNFFVPISPEDRTLFHAFPGAVLAALIDEAHTRDPQRIAAIDAGWVAVAKSTEETESENADVVA